MGRRRWRRYKSPPFRAWGTVLLAAAILLVTLREWPQAALVGGLLVVYLLFLRLTRCRVETEAHRPCRWRVRGFLGTCNVHVGDKRSMPTLVRRQGFLAVPTLMWPRSALAGLPAREERQPTPGGAGREAIAANAQRPRYDWIMLALSAAGVGIALVAVVRDFIAG